MNLFKKIMTALLFAMLVQTPAWAEEEKYTLLNPPQPTQSGNKIEVLEFFFYGCSHCYHLHPSLSAWEKQKPKDVELDFVPTIFNPQWEPMANTYYALESMNKRKQLDDTLYNAWHDNTILIEADKIADFVAQHGVDRQQFLAEYNSFTVQSKVMRSKQMVLSYHVMGTPTLVVDGKYAIVNQPDANDTIKTLNEVIAKVRKERAGKH